MNKILDVLILMVLVIGVLMAGKGMAAHLKRNISQNGKNQIISPAFHSRRVLSIASIDASEVICLITPLPPS